MSQAARGSVRVVHFAPAVLPYQTQLYNAIAARVDLQIVYLAEPNRQELWADYEDQWGTEPRFAYHVAATRSLSLSALDLRIAAPGRLGAMLDGLAPDAVSVTSWSLASISPLRWARRHRKPAVMWSESSRTSGLLRDPLSNAYRRWMLRHCDAMLVGGRAAQDYVEEMGASADQCVEALLPSTTIDDAGELRDRNQGSGPLRVLWVGRLVERKRPELAIEAFARFARASGPALLTIVGTGPLEDRVQSAAARAGVSIELVGRVEGRKLDAIYRQHDVLMVTAVREVWGLVVNEALTHDLFVISSDEVGAATSLLEVSSGRIVAAGDVEAYAEALRDFAVARLTRMPGASSSGRIRLCTPERFADQYVQAIDLARSRRAASPRHEET